MERFLSGEFDPVTHAWGFLNLPFAAASAFFDTWMMTIRKAPGRSFDGSISAALNALGKSNLGRVLLVDTRSPWIAVFADRKDAFHSEVAHPSYALRCRGIHIVWAPHTYERSSREGEFGCVAFQMLADHETGYLNVERTVGVWADTPGWEFEEEGAPLPFESRGQYQVRIVRNRFPPELLASYCRQYEIEAFDPAFYGPTFRIYEPAKRSVVAA